MWLLMIGCFRSFNELLTKRVLNCFFAFLISCLLIFLFLIYMIHCLKLGWSGGMVDCYLTVVVDG